MATDNTLRLTLLRLLMDESTQYTNLEMPPTEVEQRKLIRALMNVRPPVPASDRLLASQDAYLQAHFADTKVISLDDLAPVCEGSGIYFFRGDITQLAVNAIVNAANSQMLGCFQPLHICIDNAIHTFAGIQLRLECNRIMEAQGHEEPTGQAKITQAYNLPAKHVIHTVGPIVNGKPNATQKEQLASCYRACLTLADEHNLASIAFCCISTGVFGFPQDEAAHIAVETVSAYKDETQSPIKVIFDVFTDEDQRLYSAELGKKYGSKTSTE